MIAQDVPTLWQVTCPECRQPVTAEIPADAEPGVGIESCASGHEFLFQYDGLTLQVAGGSEQAK